MYIVNHTVHFKPTMPPHDEPLYFSPTTWYLFCMIGFFCLTAVMHGFEFTTLMHGIWYLLCLPSGYLLLTIYSAANLTDRSWGTREKKIVSNEQSNWLEIVTEYLRYVCRCCIPPSHRAREAGKVEADIELQVVGNSSTESEMTDTSDEPATPKEPNAYTGDDDDRTSSVAPRRVAFLHQFSSGDKNESIRVPGQSKAISIEEWLPSSYREYVSVFKDNGYENVSFIYGIKERDLIRMGINNRGHRNRIMQLIESLPPEDIEEEVPENVEAWLTNLGLEQYWTMFSENSYVQARDLADVKLMDKETMKNIFRVFKEGHLEKLARAVKKLQYPTKAQKKIRDAKKCIGSVPCKQLKVEHTREYHFWSGLREECLLPEEAAFGQSQELKEKLGELRNTSLIVLVVVNVLWLTFMLTVMSQGKTLQILGTDFASVGFLLVYFSVLLAQGIAMILHRFETGLHLMARTPFKPGKFVRNWSFQDEELPPEPDQAEPNPIRRTVRRSVSSCSCPLPTVLENPFAPLDIQRSNSCRDTH